MPCCPYHDYYVAQAGSGIGTIYKGAVYQKGHGIGSFLSGLLRTIMPLLKSGAKTIGKEVLVSGSNILGDLAENKNFKQSFNKRISEAGSILKNKAVNKINQMVGSGCLKRKRKRPKSHNVKNSGSGKNIAKRKKLSEDIFDKI